MIYIQIPRYQFDPYSVQPVYLRSVCIVHPDCLNHLGLVQGAVYQQVPVVEWSGRINESD